MFQENYTYPYNASLTKAQRAAQDPSKNATYPGYWSLQQTPLIYVSVPETINSRLKQVTAGEASAFTNSLSTTTLDSNQIVSFTSVQPFISEANYRGSIVNFESKSLFA